ncbi:MAG: response regulator transcription factor [Ignavibacteriae bacterium]|nr:DNA-binding response regulator [Ignavibacteriota bacterium]NOG98409.1 response regulator transcription factor [Ignavibacteriota bacterium]
MKTILIIEDDIATLKGLEETLHRENYNVICSEDGEEGFKKAVNENIDLLILDLILPSKNGIDICKELRAQGINLPILMLTSKIEEFDKVLGLEIGADDYVTKPFSIRELLARIKALLRRKAELIKDIEEYTFDNVHVDFKKMLVQKNEKEIHLSVTELNILKYFIQHKGEVISRDKLLDDIWGYEVFPTTRTVDNYILSLRKNLEDDPHSPKHIITVHKAGYKFI